MPVRLLLVRHAETTWHVEGRLQGRADVPLTERGREEAAELGDALRDVAFDSVTTSDLVRTIETARLMGHDDAPRDPAWSEGDFGDWTGRLAREVGDDYHAWRQGRLSPPGGETLESMAERATAAARRIDDGLHLVVTHGGVIRALLSGLLDLDLTRFVPVEGAHAAALEVDEPSRLLAYNLAAGAMVPSFVTG